MKPTPVMIVDEPRRFRGELTTGLLVLLNHAVRKPLLQDVEGAVVKQSDYPKRWGDAADAD